METNLVINEYCPRDCRYLSITEERQDAIKGVVKPTPHHICLKYDARLYHLSAHPDLYRCEECIKDETEISKGVEV